MAIRMSALPHDIPVQVEQPITVGAAYVDLALILQWRIQDERKR